MFYSKYKSLHFWGSVLLLDLLETVHGIGALPLIVMFFLYGSSRRLAFQDLTREKERIDQESVLYERKLKELNPAIRNITCDIADLYNFIDGLADLSALVYENSIQAYILYDRQWIKHRTFNHLKRLATH